MLVASDRVVLKLEDLVGWITEEVEWNHGIVAPQNKPVKREDPPLAAESIKKEEQEETPSNEDNKDDLKEEERTKEVDVKEEPAQGKM